MSAIFADTNVLSDIALNQRPWVEWVLKAVAENTSDGVLKINSVVYAEFSVICPNQVACDMALKKMGCVMEEIPREALFSTGRAFLAYRKHGGSRTSPLPDFFIGAHALALGLPLLTRDTARYKTYFPKLKLIAP